MNHMGGTGPPNGDIPLTGTDLSQDDVKNYEFLTSHQRYSIFRTAVFLLYSIISQFSAAGEELEKYHKSLTKSAREKDKLIKTSSKERTTAIKVAQDKEAAFLRRSKEKEDAKNQETEIGEGGWN